MVAVHRMPGRMVAVVLAVVGAAALTVGVGGSARAAAPVVLGDGSGIALPGDDPKSVTLCTLNSVGWDAQNRLVGLTAGHCGNVGMPVWAEADRGGPPVGTIANKGQPGRDWAVIQFDPDRIIPVRHIGPTTINGYAAPPTTWQPVCKNGRTTGFSCGPVVETRSVYFEAEACSSHGDSGGPVLVGDRLAGLLTSRLVAELGSILVDPDCRGPADIVFLPLIALQIGAVLDDIAAHGGVGTGLRLL